MRSQVPWLAESPCCRGKQGSVQSRDWCFRKEKQVRFWSSELHSGSRTDH